jgi:hypothetical protein
LSLISPKDGRRSVGIVRSRTEATEFSLVYKYHHSVLSDEPHVETELLRFTVDIAAGQQRDRTSIPGRFKNILFSPLRPYRLWGQSSLLSEIHQGLFPGGEAAEA